VRSLDQPPGCASAHDDKLRVIRDFAAPSGARFDESHDRCTQHVPLVWFPPLFRATRRDPEQRALSLTAAKNYALRSNAVDPLHHVADPDLAALDNAAVAADGVVAAGPKICLHAGARRALAGSLKQRRADAKASIFQG
jgi:hypothetical protein